MLAKISVLTENFQKIFEEDVVCLKSDSEKIGIVFAVGWDSDWTYDDNNEEEEEQDEGEEQDFYEGDDTNNDGNNDARLGADAEEDVSYEDSEWTEASDNVDVSVLVFMLYPLTTALGLARDTS